MIRADQAALSCFRSSHPTRDASTIANSERVSILTTLRPPSSLTPPSSPLSSLLPSVCRPAPLLPFLLRRQVLDGFLSSLPSPPVHPSTWPMIMASRIQQACTVSLRHAHQCLCAISLMPRSALEIPLFGPSPTNIRSTTLSQTILLTIITRRYINGR
jgi:hypothetical protein